MKKLFVMTLIAGLMAMCLTGCGAEKKTADKDSGSKEEAVEETAEEESEGKDQEESESKEDNIAGMANPWIDCDKDKMLEVVGFGMNAPEGATDVSYQLNEAMGLGQMTFKYGEPEMEYTYRIKSATEFEDISGENYEWTNEVDDKVSWCDAKIRRYVGDGESVESCIWYDVVPGFAYSLSARSDKDLDGYDILAIAYQVYEPMQDDVEVGFIPGNFLEEKIQKDEFKSFDEIISNLSAGNGYATIKVYGSDKDVLAITESTYDNLDGSMATIDASLYMEDEGIVRCIGSVFSNGTAYPISQNEEGMICSGGNHEAEISCIADGTSSIMNLVYAYESFDENGNATYGGFVRESNTFDEDKEVEIGENDSELYQKQVDKVIGAKPINFTVVK